MFLIVGLGNPGIKYKNTRHNAGFFAVDELAQKIDARFTKRKFRGIIAETIVGTEHVVLLKPHTFMNLSGFSVDEAVSYYKVPHENLIVVYDDIDLDLGKLRVRASGSAGTHNGMRSIIECLGYKDFPRVRVGIGKPKHSLIDHVIAKMSKEELTTLKSSATSAASATLLIVTDGIAAAQQSFN